MPPARAAGLSPASYHDSGMRWVKPGVAGPAADIDAQAFVRSFDEAVADFAAHLTYWRPDLVISYDADGGYFHPDHIHCHEIASAAAARLGLPFVEIVSETRPDAPDIEWVDRPDLIEDVAKALRCHRTQLTVQGDTIVHSGGQIQLIQTRTGVRRA